MKNCKHCKTQFKDKSRNQSAIFCTKECKNAYWYINNKDRSIANSKLYISNNIDQVRAAKRNYVNKRRAEDINFRLASNMRSRISRAMVKGFKQSSLSQYLGCSMEELKNHLESKFDIGMSWDNYGEWEIDHIFPLAKADLTNIDVFNKICHYTNLQPLWSEANKVKKDSV